MKFVNGSTSLDISSGPTNGFYYVTSDANGAFTVNGDYTCTSGQQVYLYAVGGNPGSGTNSAAGFLAMLGNCPTANNFAATVPNLWINEVTTVAAAYSMSAFAYDALHVSSPSSALSKRNIQNAFANANNIVDITNNAWFFGSGPDTIVELDSQGNQLQTFGRISGYGTEHNVALDGSGNAWLTSGAGVYQLIGLVTPVVTPIASNLVSPYTTPASKPQ